MWRVNQRDRSQCGTGTHRTGDVPACATQCPESCKVMQTGLVVAGKQKCLLGEGCVSAFYSSLAQQQQCKASWHFCLRGQTYLLVRNVWAEYLSVYALRASLGWKRDLQCCRWYRPKLQVIVCYQECFQKKKDFFCKKDLEKELAFVQSRGFESCQHWAVSRQDGGYTALMGHCSC